MKNVDKLTEEKLKSAILHGYNLLANNGLDEWIIKTNNKTSSLAETWHDEKTIFFSKKFIIVSDKEQFEGIALHEITHALLGPGYGHGKTFRELCTKISKTDKYACTSITMQIKKYTLTCKDCGYVGNTNAIGHDRYCSRCFDNYKIVKLVPEQNTIEVKVWE